MAADLPPFRVRALSDQAYLMKVEQKQVVFTDLVHPFLSRDDLAGTLSPISVLSYHNSCCSSLSIIEHLSLSFIGVLFKSSNVRCRTCLSFRSYKQRRLAREELWQLLHLRYLAGLENSE